MIPPGGHAPGLTLPDTHGTPVALASLERPVLLVFLPAAFTPICTGELTALAGIQPRLARAGALALAVGCDSVFALRTWADAENLDDGPEGLRLLSDFWPHGAASRAYEAFDESSGLSTRTSYLTDGGVVRWSVQTSPGVARDLEEHAVAVEHLLGAA